MILKNAAQELRYLYNHYDFLLSKAEDMLDVELINYYFCKKVQIQQEFAEKFPLDTL